MRCLVDLDGVLVNLLDGWLEAKGYKKPDPWPAGLADFHCIFGIAHHEIWEGLDWRFWANLRPMDDADDIINTVSRIFGSQVYLLTSVVADPSAAAGKLHWISKHYPRYGNRVIITSCRTALANIDTILLDDEDRNIEPFKEAGGNAIQVPRVWNKRHLCSSRAISTIANEMLILKNARARQLDERLE